MNTRSIVTASVVAGVATALLSNLPVLAYGNCLACLWLWVGGILGVLIYSRSEHPARVMTAGQGVVVGALSGLIGALAGTLIGTFFGGVGLASILTPLSSNAGEAAGGLFGSFAMSGSFNLLGLLFNAFIYPFFGAIGGGAAGVVLGANRNAQPPVSTPAGAITDRSTPERSTPVDEPR